MVQRKVSFLFLILLLFSQSCLEDEVDCAAVLCAGPPSIGLEILLDGENIFLNHTYTLDDVSLTGVTTSEVRTTLFFEPATQKTVLVLSLVSVNLDSFEFAVNLSDDFSINIDMDTSLTPAGGCCGGIPILETLQIDGVEQDLATFTYTINLN
ncbi:hypothetical protein ACOKFD_09285 [Flagellimonas sp. S174]|uniref:hypothetical protein n=1 Tax=Flagellimonas sp. S174 TaxID=3410790 RepID=UPI003BF5F53E